MTQRPFQGPPHREPNPDDHQTFPRSQRHGLVDHPQPVVPLRLRTGQGIQTQPHQPKPSAIGAGPPHSGPVHPGAQQFQDRGGRPLAGGSPQHQLQKQGNDPRRELMPACGGTVPHRRNGRGGSGGRNERFSRRSFLFPPLALPTIEFGLSLPGLVLPHLSARLQVRDFGLQPLHPQLCFLTLLLPLIATSSKETQEFLHRTTKLSGLHRRPPCR